MSHPMPRTMAVLREGMKRGLHLGAQIYVSLQGRNIADEAIGESRPGVAMTTDTLTLWMSMGKPVTAILIARLVDAGVIDLQQRVHELIPEFGQHGKDQITLAHLLTHSGGFRNVGSNWTGESWEAVIDRINAATLEEEWVVGETAGYHTSSSWFILAEIARRAWKYDDPREMYRKEVFEPLGMSDCWVGMPRHKWMSYGTQVAYMFDTSRRTAAGEKGSAGEGESEDGSTVSAESEVEREDGVTASAKGGAAREGALQAGKLSRRAPKPLASANSESGATMCRPGGNARGPMNQLGLFYEQLLIDRAQPGSDARAQFAHTGRFESTTDRRRFLSSDVALRFTSRQLARVYDRTFGTKLDWGYGFIINTAAGKFPYNYGPHASPEAFGHSGNQCTCAFADPEHGLVVCWATNGMPGELVHQRRQRATNAAVYEDLQLA